MGMPSNEFWDGNPRLFLSYKKAFEMSEERRTIELDTLAWLTGSYDMQAFAIVLSQAFSKSKTRAKYPPRPSSFTKVKTNKKKVKESELMAQYSGFVALADAMNEQHTRKTV